MCSVAIMLLRSLSWPCSARSICMRRRRNATPISQTRDRNVSNARHRWSSLADTNRHHAVLLLRMNAGLVRVIGESEATTLTIYHLATRVLLRLVNLVLAFNTQNSILE